MSRSRALSRRGIVAVLAAATLMTIGSSPAAAADPPRLNERVPSPTRGPAEKGAGSPAASQPTGRLMVRYREGASAATRLRVRAAVGATFVSRVAVADTELVDPAGAVADAMAGLRRDPAVLSVEPEYRRAIAAGPVGEPLFGQQWSLHNTGQVVNGFTGAPDVDMNVPEAWEVTTGSPSIVVAVIDDGVDLSHPDLAGRAWVNPGEIAGNGVDDEGNGHIDDVNGWDFCNNDNSVHDADDSHGTHVAGSIAASGNGVGIAGVAPTVRIMAIKFISNDPLCATDTQAIASIQYAAAHGAHIINASWGSQDYNASLAAAIAAASSSLFVAAAGNQNSDNTTQPFYPASYTSPNILSVASIHNEGFLSGFSNFGLTSVDLSAPGDDVLSTLPGAAYGYLSGTSMSAANASGAAALAASARAALPGDGAALRTHMIATARALPSTLGWVRNPRLIDARAAVVSRPDIRRLYGADRYATAAAISAATFTPHVPYLFIATGEGFPDALAGGALAAQVGAPLLLVRAGSIPAATLTEIQRLKPLHILVLGGVGVVSAAVEAQLAAYDKPASTGPYRLAGADRYATAVAISQAGFDPGGWVFVADGANFPDALAGGPAAAVAEAPVLLVRATSIPQATRDELTRLHPTRIVILGGTGVVSQAVASELAGYASVDVVRWWGANRYATAAAVASQAFPASATAFIAAGLTFPDALPGGAAAGAYAAPLLLTAMSTTPDATKQELLRLRPVRIFILGGPGVIADSVIAEIQALFP